MIRRISVAMVAKFLTLATAIPAYADCSDVIKLSMNSTSEFVTQSDFENDVRNFCRSYNRQKQAGSTVGVDAKYKVISLGFKSGSNSADAISDKYCDENNSVDASAGAYRKFIHEVAPQAYSSYNQCVSEKRSFNVTIGSATSDYAPITVNFVPQSAGEYAEIMVSTDSSVQCDLKEPKKMDKAGNFLIACSRTNVTKPGSITVTNLAGGMGTISVPWTAYTAPDGIPIDLARRYLASVEEMNDFKSALKDGIVAFDKASCPAGFEPYAPAYGVFIRGIDPEGQNDEAGRAPGSFQDSMIGRHAHNSVVSADRMGHPDGSGDTCRGKSAACSYWRGNKDLELAVASAPTTHAGGDETRPKNIALLHCKYTGDTIAVAVD